MKGYGALSRNANERIELVGGVRLFQLLDEVAEPILFGFCNDQKFNTNSLRPAPSHCRILNLDGICFSRKVQKQRDLHTGEWADQAFHAAAFRREVSNRSLVPELIALNQRAWHADGKAAMFASDHELAFLGPKRLRRRGLVEIVPAVPALILPFPKIPFRIHIAASIARLPSVR